MNRLKKCVEILNEKVLDFVVIVGDLVNENPDGNTEKRTEQVACFNDAISGLKHKVYCLPGNHDVSKGNFITGDLIKDGERDISSVDNFKNEFGEIAYDKFCFEIGNVNYIGLNSNFWQLDQDKVQNGDFSKLVPEKTAKHDQFEYLQKKLDSSSSKRTILFCHHPLFYSGSKLICDKVLDFSRNGIEESHRYSIWNLLTILWKSNASHIFCGHTHANKIVKLEILELNSKLSCIQTSSLSSNQKNFLANLSCVSGRGIPLPVFDQYGFRLVTVSDDEVNHEFVKI